MNRRKRGQALIMMTLALIPMMGILGMVADLGYMHYLRESAQAAADAGAMAAIVYFHSNNSGSSFTCSSSIACESSYSCPSSISSATDAVSTACLYVKQNGFTNSGNQTVTIDSNVSGTAPANVSGVSTAAYWMTVTVGQTVPQLFAAVQGNTSGKIAAVATAAVAPSKDCIYVLDPSDANTYYQNGNTTVKSACGIYDNSSSGSALSNSGNSTLQASEYDIVGNYSWHGTLTPTPSTGAASTPDPLKNLPVPGLCSSSGGCDAESCPKGSNGTTLTKDTNYGSGTTYFCGGLSVKNANVTFGGGTYIFVGGGFTLQDTNSNVSGSGLFYNTYDSNHAYGTVSFPANSTVTLSASTSGTYAGILFMQDRHCCSPTTNLLYESFQGGPTTKFEGTLYFPVSAIQFAGNPTLNIARYTLIVAWQLSMLGTSYVNNDYSLLSGGSPIQQVSLIQ